MDKTIAASMILIAFLLIPSFFYIRENSIYFTYDDATFVWHRVPVIYETPTTITTAWIYGNVIITPPVVTINGTEYTFMSVYKTTAVAYLGQISGVPKTVQIGTARFHKAIVMGPEVLSVILTIILVYVLIIIFDKIEPHDRKKIALSAYLIILTATLLSTAHVVHMTTGIPLEGSQFVVFSKNNIVHTMIYSGTIPVNLVTTTFSAFCSDSRLHVSIRQNYMFIFAPTDCKTFTVHTYTIHARSLLKINPYFSLAILVLNTFIYSIMLLIYSTFREEI